MYVLYVAMYYSSRPHIRVVMNRGFLAKIKMCLCLSVYKDGKVVSVYLRQVL